jgi:hypothetical protein
MVPKHQRRRLGLPLQPPDAAIDPSKDVVSIGAAMAMRATFAQGDRAEAQAVLALFDALVDLR